MIALRSAGFNHVDLAAAQKAGIPVARVPAYSPHAVAEHAIALILTLNRQLHRAYNRVRDGNFALDGLLGFDLHGKTVGIVGTGQIGALVAQILKGFGCDLLAFDPYENPACIDLGVRYVDLDALLSQSDIITLQCPLTPETHHLIDVDAIAKMKPGAMIINTSRGAVVDTTALIAGLKAGPSVALVWTSMRKRPIFLRGPVPDLYPRRCLCATADLSQRADHRPSGFSRMKH